MHEKGNIPDLMVIFDGKVCIFANQTNERLGKRTKIVAETVEGVLPHSTRSSIVLKRCDVMPPRIIDELNCPPELL